MASRLPLWRGTALRWMDARPVAAVKWRHEPHARPSIASACLRLCLGARRFPADPGLLGTPRCGRGSSHHLRPWWRWVNACRPAAAASLLSRRRGLRNVRLRRDRGTGTTPGCCAAGLGIDRAGPASARCPAARSQSCQRQPRPRPAAWL